MRPGENTNETSIDHAGHCGPATGGCWLVMGSAGILLHDRPAPHRPAQRHGRARSGCNGRTAQRRDESLDEDRRGAVRPDARGGPAHGAVDDLQDHAGHDGEKRTHPARGRAGAQSGQTSGFSGFAVRGHVAWHGPHPGWATADIDPGRPVHHLLRDVRGVGGVRVRGADGLRQLLLQRALLVLRRRDAGWRWRSAVSRPSSVASVSSSWSDSTSPPRWPQGPRA